MITKIFPLQFLKKSPFFGSYAKMNYRLMKIEDDLNLCIYPGPFCFESTPEEHKLYFNYEFSDSGYDQAVCCLNEIYNSGAWKK